MTALLERAVNEAATLSDDEQNAIAARILAEKDDESEWGCLFASTTNEQWDRLAAIARHDIDAEDSSTLEERIRGEGD